MRDSICRVSESSRATSFFWTSAHSSPFSQQALASLDRPLSRAFQDSPEHRGLDVPLNWLASSEFNLERLRRHLRRPSAMAADAEEPAPVQGLDGQLEHEVEAILKFSMQAVRPHVLVR